jgi:hypothetical protein
MTPSIRESIGSIVGRFARGCAAPSRESSVASLSYVRRVGQPHPQWATWTGEADDLLTPLEQYVGEAVEGWIAKSRCRSTSPAASRQAGRATRELQRPLGKRTEPEVAVDVAQLEADLAEPVFDETRQVNDYAIELVRA